MPAPARELALPPLDDVEALPGSPLEALQPANSKEAEAKTSQDPRVMPS
jgi:hypothetical protein